MSQAFKRYNSLPQIVICLPKVSLIFLSSEKERKGLHGYTDTLLRVRDVMSMQSLFCHWETKGKELSTRFSAGALIGDTVKRN